MVQIENIEKLRFKFCITLDNGQKYYLTKSQFYERGLKAGQEIDPEEFDHWVLLNQYRSALDKAVVMLARRPCSKGEIEIKLFHSGYSSQTIEMVLYKLEKESLINDEDFAKQWIQYRRSQKLGEKKIAAELKYKKNVSPEIVDQVMLETANDETELEQASELALKLNDRYKKENDPLKKKQKIMRALVQKGYSWDIAKEAFMKISDSEV